ncbi:5'-deoxynucleotidase [Christensenellaceae bacterium OttesenSCG-928-K19]|nr:5'-deoxynucleotidase [Christensenellaceae bacterium OttesenSCG-928-K19]
MKKSFYAYLSRLKHIKRWGLMRNTLEENVAEHSFHVATIAHALCVIKNELFDGHADEKEVLLAAIYHETGEAITGDLPTPVKYFDEEITQAYKKIERQAEQTMVDMLPEEMKPRIAPYVLGQISPETKQIVKAADKICAYIKCVEEKKSGNSEFDKAALRIRENIDAMELPEIEYFMRHFMESYALTLDELNE